MAGNELEFVIVTTECKPRGKVAEEVARKVAAGECLNCTRPANSYRGNCTTHYLKFIKARAAEPKGRRALFEQKAIAAGKILESNQGKHGETVNPFEQFASK